MTSQKCHNCLEKNQELEAGKHLMRVCKKGCLFNAKDGYVPGKLIVNKDKAVNMLTIFLQLLANGSRPKAFKRPT